AIESLKIGKVIDDNLNWIGKDTIVVQVGDQIDSCRPSEKNNFICNKKSDDLGYDRKVLDLFTDLDLKARKHNGKVISLLGNHELMNVQGFMDYVSYQGFREFDGYKDPKTGKVFSSGNNAREYAFKPGNEYANLLGCTRVSTIIIGSNLFVHAGFLDELLDMLKIKKLSDLDHINIIIRKWLLGLVNKEYIGMIINADKNSPFWTRILG